MSVFIPDSRLAAEVHFVEIWMLTAAFCIWFFKAKKIDEWVPLIGTASVALQLLAWALFVGYGWTAAWNVLTTAGLLFLVVAAIGAIATIRHTKPWYQRVFELTIIASFCSEVVVLAMHLFTLIHG